MIEKEILVQRYGHLELVIVNGLRYQPAVMDKHTPILELRIHHNRHEVITLHYIVEYLL